MFWFRKGRPRVRERGQPHGPRSPSPSPLNAQHAQRWPMRAITDHVLFCFVIVVLGLVGSHFVRCFVVVSTVTIEANL